MSFVVNFYTPSFWGSVGMEPNVLVSVAVCSATELYPGLLDLF